MRMHAYFSKLQSKALEDNQIDTTQVPTVTDPVVEPKPVTPVAAPVTDPAVTGTPADPSSTTLASAATQAGNTAAPATPEAELNDFVQRESVNEDGVEAIEALAQFHSAMEAQPPSTEGEYRLASLAIGILCQSHKLPEVGQIVNHALESETDLESKVAGLMRRLSQTVASGRELLTQA